MKRMCGRWMMMAVFGGALVGLTGCKPNEAVKQTQVIGDGAAAKPTSAPLDPATLGMVSGTVRFAGKAPQRVKIDMSQDPVCSMMGGDNFAEQYVVKDGKLANVYVYVKSGPAAAMSAPAVTTAPVVLDQVGCKYVPHVIAVMQGGSVEFRNSDSTMHNIHTMPEAAKNASRSMFRRGQRVRSGGEGVCNQPEVMFEVRCNNHPWMNAFINVAPTTFLAVTDAEGHFGISGLPAGDYVLTAVHEKMGEQDIHVTVKPQETVKADYSFSAK